MASLQPGAIVQGLHPGIEQQPGEHLGAQSPPKATSVPSFLSHSASVAAPGGNTQDNKCQYKRTQRGSSH